MDVGALAVIGFLVLPVGFGAYCALTDCGCDVVVVLN
jgi:hypothetical protein